MNPQEQPQQAGNEEQNARPQASTVTHNLDTGKDEPLDKPSDDSGIMDFASGSGGGSGGDGAAA